MQDDQLFAQDSTVPPPLLFNGTSLLGGADALPRIPTMVATRLRLEFLLGDHSVDLKEMAEVILSDAGATLQILRLIGEEYPNEEDRPTRIEDCIVSLNRERWYEVVCASGTSHNGPLVSEWQHCRQVAECARELARCVDGFVPEEAYLVGLLHRLGKFPDLLGWKPAGDLARMTEKEKGSEYRSGEDRALSLMLADYWHLPGYLLSALGEQSTGEQGAQETMGEWQPAPPPAGWGSILRAAERLAGQALGSPSGRIA